jgi:diketogulonate reductase-like aldo/keto reductase
MIRKQLGTTGVLIPEVGIGTWDYHSGAEPIRRGLETGALFVDTAESYATEPVVGEAIAGIRDKIFLATKISPENFRSDAVARAVDSSLYRMRVETIDLMQLHHPNPAIPIEETIGALLRAVDAGKVKFIGVSNFSVKQLQAAQKASGKHPIVSNQVRYSIIDRTIEKDLLPYCQANRITVIAYSPLGRGLGRVRDCDPHHSIERLARELTRTEAQIVLNWCLCKEGVVAIPKGGSVAHIVENCGASDWRLTEEQLGLLDQTIQYRHRTAFDVMLRRYAPQPLQQMGRRMLSYLPRGLRRRVT